MLLCMDKHRGTPQGTGRLMYDEHVDRGGHVCVRLITSHSRSKALVPSDTSGVE
jgi:hypothetical protein